MSGRGALRALGWCTVIAVASLIALELHLGSPRDRNWWLPAALFTCWTAAPLVAPWLFARLRPYYVRPAAFGLVATSAIALILYWRAFRDNPSSTSALALIFVPFWQWGALAVVATATLLSGIRRR